ncbi:MAG: PAS domain-containing protein [Desulfobacteraceae bacterium]|jgi:PAS domain S-box-containing protein
MKLRSILIALALLAFLSAWIGGYLYYASLKESAFKEANRQAALHAETIKNHLSFFLGKNLNSVRAMAGLRELREALSKKDKDSVAKTNSILDHFNNALRADVCYLMDRHGNTIASTNRKAADSFVGKNYAFRPYFQQAIKGDTGIYMALGITSRRRGVYHSHPVFGKDQGTPLGVAVIKAPIDVLEKDFSQAYEGVVMLTDPHGIVLLSNRSDWVLHSLWKLSPEDMAQVEMTRQFGKGPWHWTGLDLMDETHATDQSGNQYLLHKLEIDNYPGWNLIYLTDTKAIFRRVSTPLIKISGYLILTLCVLIGLAVFILYRKASHDILQRRKAEEALRESEQTQRALLNAPTESALLLDAHGNILALNTPAANAFGKSVDELLGLCAFDLFSADVAKRRKAYHNEVINSCKPVRYEDERQGRWHDTNVYPVFDAEGRVVRVAIFSRDITEWKHAEKALKLAKDHLTRYSKDLEVQVRERTKEITGIIENTPAVVFMKDRDFRYVMVNSRYEELFGIRNDEIKGKSDYDIFPKETADQFRANDLQVFTERRSFQVEENVPQNDGVHIYLSVKFPIYDEQETVRSVCGIATDITELKRTQDRMRRLSAKIMTGQEKERAAIARELHDELGQMLTALRMDAVWIRDHLSEKDPKARERTLAMCKVIDKTIDEVRGMAVRLRPKVLDELGLTDAIEWYTTEFEKRSGVASIFKHMDVPPVKDILSTATYRIAQEALTNVARHSFATHVDVTLQAENDMLLLSVMDNGVGFNIQSLSDDDTLGIAGMRERANLVGGKLDVQSEPGKGTTIHFRVPLHGSGGTHL